MAPQGPWRWTPEKIKELAEDLLSFMADPEHTYFKEWCVERKIPSSHVTRFAELNPKFAEALELANDIQETRLCKGGLRGTHHHAIVKLILTSKFNYTERSDMAVTATPARTLPASVEECDKLIQEAQDHRNRLETMLTDAMKLGTGIVE